jgi:O-antigen biosynthesis protein
MVLGRNPSPKASSVSYTHGAMQEPEDHVEPNLAPAELTHPGRSGRLRVCLITTEFHGLFKNGGIGTANTGLALSLARAGFDVTVAFADADEKGPRIKEGSFPDLQKNYRKLGVSLDYVPASPIIAKAFDDARSASYCVYLYLKKNRFDVVYFNDCGGHGYYALLAKRVGSFRNAPRMYVVAHGPQEWVLELNSLRYWDRSPVVVAYLERRSASLADALISPSQYLVDWMIAHDWTMPAKVMVIQNIVPLPDAAVPTARYSKPVAVKEIVFFGRLEVRKGIELFCDAIDLLNESADLTGIRITFMGKFHKVAELHSGVYIVERAHRWQSSLRVLVKYGQEEALSYLQQPGHLAVIPSLAENSPCVVAECLQLGVPFVATESGGTIELVAPEDRDLCLVPADPQSLATTLDRILKSGHRSGRLAISQAESFAGWLRLTDPGKECPDESLPEPLISAADAVRTDPSAQPLVSVCLAHPSLSSAEEELLGSLFGQSYARLEFILFDDGKGGQRRLSALAALKSAEERFPVRIVPGTPGDRGAARNAAAAQANGEYLLFVEEGSVILMPECVEALVRAALRTGADILTAMPFSHNGGPAYLREGMMGNFPIGACAELGGAENCFGNGLFLINRSSFHRRSGFETPCDLEIEDWLFLATSVLAGLQLEVVPEPLFWYHSEHNVGLARSKAVDNHRRILAAYSGQKVEIFKHVLEAIAPLGSAENTRLRPVLDNVNPEASKIALRVSSLWEPNSEEALRGFTQFCIECHKVEEALDFALYNDRSILSDVIDSSKMAAEPMALDSVRRHTLDSWHELALTDDIRQRVYPASDFPEAGLDRPLNAVASHSIETGVRILKAAAVCPPGTASLQAIAEVEGSRLPAVFLALIASTPNARLNLSEGALESSEAFWWSGWVPAGEGGGPLELRVLMLRPPKQLLDLHFLCRTSDDGSAPEGTVTWKSVVANLSVNGAITSSAVDQVEVGTPIPREVLDQGTLLTENSEFSFSLYVPGDRTLLHPIPGRPVLVRLSGAVPPGATGVRSVVSLELAESHPVQFAVWIRSSLAPVMDVAEFTSEDAFSGWFSVTDKFRHHSFTLALTERTTEEMDLYLATRVVDYPDVYYCHAVWHRLLVLD